MFDENINHKFRLFNDDSDFDAVGEYEVDIPYTYAPIYMDNENFSLNRSENSADSLFVPAPAADIPPQTSPPPFIPSKTETNNNETGVTSNVTKESISSCVNKFTYIWQLNGKSYWAFISSYDSNSISGWRFISFKWVYFGLDIKKIDSFITY